MEVEISYDYKFIESLTDFPTNPTHLYLLIKKDTQTVGVFELQKITNITASVHMHIIEEYQQQGIANKTLYPLLDYIRFYTSYKKLIATVASTNEHIQKVLDKTDFVFCGLITDGIIWNDRIDDLLIYQLEVI